jgi:phosphoglycerate dehydrogenase-like enzyme
LLTHEKSFAFLDVFEKEPFSEEWHGFPQVWKTSHIAGCEKDLDKKMLNFERDVLEDFLSLNDMSFLKKYEKELIQNKWIKGVLV